MSFVLSIHSAKAFKEFLLPAVNNTDHSIILNKDIFVLNNDIELIMEVVENKWRFLPSEQYRIEDTVTKENYFNVDFKGQDLLTVVLPNGEHISVIVDKIESSFNVFRKYNLQNINEITIGKNENNVICYDTRNLISRDHAVIRRHGEQFVLEDRSANGVFVNSRRIVGSRQLEFGDYINIFGLSIVFLGNILAVDSLDEKVMVNENWLKRYQEPDYKKNELQSRDFGKKTVYHRSPRQIYKIDEDTVEIEAPPQPRNMNKKSIGMLIGPSMTMALPMLLGCGLAIYSTKTHGGSSGAFMYTGLITAISSAMIGTMWALLNLRAEKKRLREEEMHRFEAYGEYLIKCSTQIKEKYEKNIQSLNAMYLSAEECCKFDERNSLLWNRNANHADFLSHRLGIGNMPFQVKISIPKEKFTLINDSLAEKPAMIQKSYKELQKVPLGVDLAKHRMVGIVGGTMKRGAVSIMHNLAAQIAVSNCYTNVKMVFLFDEGEDDISNWQYLKWLPHVWSEDKKTRYIANGKVEAGEVLYEITQILRARAEKRNEYSSANKLNLPQYVLFVSNSELLKGELINKYIEDEDNKDLTTVFLVDNYENLPNACNFIIQNDDKFKGMYDIRDDIEERTAIQFDEISDSQMEKLARTLADIEVNETEMGGDIPASLSFLDMYGVNRLDELNVLDKWRKNRTYDSMKAVIGQRAGGESWYLDIHEKYHGPHGLVAGTTGSGKSETLQTYILSLALNFSPDDVGFFLIDYKGGGMANLFNGLPHMIGQISNLSGNQVKRALVSIKSENKRRQRIFNEHGVNNINLYTKLYKNNEATEPVPHMFIIIDEFAELKREEPDFMRELISVAQVGRSLGVHLILATQKPSGTVDDNIWSNSKFKLCLRVQDRQDSNDMLHRPDAAYITQAGRCYMQVGNDELFELFQSGFSGAAYDEDSGSMKADIATMVSNTGKAALVGNRLKLKQKESLKRNWIRQFCETVVQITLPQNQSMDDVLSDPVLAKEYIANIFEKLKLRKIDYPYSDYNAQRVNDLLTSWMEVTKKKRIRNLDEAAEEIIAYADMYRLKLPERKQKTQLDAVVEYLAKVAKENGYIHNLQLWLPVLPQKLYLNQLSGYIKEQLFDGKKWNSQQKEWNIEVSVGMYDDPVNQAQGTLTINLSQNGHHALIGTAMTGKSTFLQTFMYALVQKYTPEIINIYAIDFSAKMLSAFENMPHVGGVILENEDDKLAKFFNMLESVLNDRKQLFKGGNYSQYVRANGVVLPAIVLVIDNFSNFKVKTNDKYEDIILRLSKDGVGYGIFMVITAGGFSYMEIPNKIGENIRTTICLEMNDRTQYANVLRVMRVETLPEVNTKGRGLARVGEDFLEFQTALAFEAEDDFKRIEGIEKLAVSMRQEWNGKCARPIPVIPDKPIWSEFAELEDTIKMAQGDRYLPVGYDSQNAAVYGINLAKTYCYLIAGKERTGKTNMLKVILNAVLLRNADITIVDFSGDFTYLAEKLSLPYIDTDQKMYDFLVDLKPDFVARNLHKKECIKQGMSDEEIYLDMQQFKAKFVLITNFADFVTHVNRPKDVPEMKAAVENFLEKGSLHNVFWIACYNPEDVGKVAGIKMYDHFLKYKKGIYFGGNVAGQKIMNFDYVPYAEQSKTLKPGIGMLPANDEDDVKKVVIPLVKG